MDVLPTYMCPTGVQCLQESEEGVRYSRIPQNGFELLCWCWELNPGPLDNQCS